MNGSVLLSPDALHCLKRKQLTNLCRRFGIKAVGKNTDLIQRLQDYAASNIPTDSPTKGNVVVLRHVKRPRQSDSSSESGTDDPHVEKTPSLPYPPLTPRTKHKRVSDLVKAIQEVKSEMDDMDTDDEHEDLRASQRNTIAFPVTTPLPSRQRSPLLPPLRLQGDLTPASPESTQPLRIIKALPSSSRIASPLSTSTILEMSRSDTRIETGSGLYPNLTTLPIPESVSRACLASSSTLPSITSRQFSAAAASVLAEMNARLAAAGRSTTDGSLATLSSVGNATWQTLAASASAQGMSKSRSGRYEIRHERQFNKMDSIVNHYAARRVGAGLAEKSEEASQTVVNTSGSAATKPVAASTSTRMVPSTSSQRRPRADASTSTRGLAAMARSTSTRNMPVKRRPLPVPPVAQSKPPSATSSSAQSAKSIASRPARSNNTTEASRCKRLRLAVSEEQGALQNTVLEIPPEKKTVVIRVTKPEREGMPYKFSVTSSDSDHKIAGATVGGPTRAASSLRKTVIKATKSTFAGSASTKKSATSAQTLKREAAFAKQQQQQAALSRSISSRANLAVSPAGKTEGVTASPSVSVRNKFTGVETTARGCGVVETDVGVAEVRSNVACPNTRQPSVAASASSRASSKLGGSVRSSVVQGLVRAEAARQTRLQEIKARTKAALAGFASQRSVSSSTSASTGPTLTTSSSARKALAFSTSVTRPTIASLNRAAANGSSSVPMLHAITETPLQRAATVQSEVAQTHTYTPNLTPRSSSLRHLRRVMRRQQKQADLDQVRIAAAENIAPGTVVTSVIAHADKVDSPTIRTVGAQAASDRFTTLPIKTRVRVTAGPRPALTSSAMN